MAIVEKHSPASTGSYAPSTLRASENSFSNATRSVSPRSARRAIMRFRNVRWQTGAGSPSRPQWSVSTAPVYGA